MGWLPTVWTAALLASTAPIEAGQGSALLECSEPVCWTAALLEADGREAPEDGLARVTLGETLEWFIDVAAPQDAGVFVPSNPALGSFRLVQSVEEVLPVAEGSKQRRTRTRMQLRALRMGAEAIPSIEVTWRLADGTTGSFKTPRRRVRVAGRLDNEQDPALGARPAPVSVVATNWTLVTLATLLGGGLLALLLAPLVRRLRRGGAPEAPPPPPRPANEVALEALDWLETAELSPEERYAGAVDTLRAYLGGRYGFDGLESTTVELMEELASRDVDGVATTEVHAILDDADLVKFAKLVPGAEAALALVERVREIVIATWVDEPEPEPELDGESEESVAWPLESGESIVVAARAPEAGASTGAEPEFAPPAEGTLAEPWPLQAPSPSETVEPPADEEPSRGDGA